MVSSMVGSITEGEGQEPLMGNGLGVTISLGEVTAEVKSARNSSSGTARSVWLQDMSAGSPATF